jgi:hypothetical protein
MVLLVRIERLRDNPPPPIGMVRGISINRDRTN